MKGKAAVLALVAALASAIPAPAQLKGGAVSQALKKGRQQTAPTKPPAAAGLASRKGVAITGGTVAAGGGSAVQGAPALITAGAVPIVASTGTLTQDAGLRYTAAGNILGLGTGDDQIELRPKNTETFGVLSVRSGYANKPTAVDFFPNGTPPDGDQAWNDICAEDLLSASPPPWHCLGLITSRIGSSYYHAIGAHSADTTYGSLSLGGSTIYFQNHVGGGAVTNHGRWGQNGLFVYNNYSETGDRVTSALRYDGPKIAKDVAYRFSGSTDGSAAADAALIRGQAGQVTVLRNPVNGIGLTAATPGDFAARNIMAHANSALGSESLNETTFATTTKWAVAGDFACASGTCAYTHSSGSGTLTQAQANLAAALVGLRPYKLQYDVKAQTGPAPNCGLPATVAQNALALDSTVANSKWVVFQTLAAPADFQISCTSTASGTYQIDNVSLKEMRDGDVVAGGTVSAAALVSKGGSAGKAACFKADGMTLGYCSTTVDAGGGCTCN